MTFSASAFESRSTRCSAQFSSLPNVAAVVVLYHPGSELLHRVIASVSRQANCVIIIDNTPGGPSERAMQTGYDTKIVFGVLGENTGIANAQNIGIERAMDLGCSHVILLDQDSVMAPGTIANLLAAEKSLIAKGINVAAVGPLFVDEKTGEACHAIRHGILRVNRVRIDPASTDPVQSDYLIASGSLIRTSIFGIVGLMRPELFIDWVDIEWGLRAKSLGFDCYLVPTAHMSHSIGDATTRLLWKSINLHNDVRNRYIVRNAAYLLKTRSMGWRWRIVTAIKIPQYIVFYAYHSARRLNALFALVRAAKLGTQGRVGKLD